jgi:hypothetical protein
MSFESFKDFFPAIFGRSGGRKASQPDMLPLDTDTKTWLNPCAATEARLTIVQITDVYTLGESIVVSFCVWVERVGKNVPHSF